MYVLLTVRVGSHKCLLLMAVLLCQYLTTVLSAEIRLSVRVILCKYIIGTHNEMLTEDIVW